jgi:hypothetical protein
VGAGTGISVGADTVALASNYADGSAYDTRFVNEGQANSVTSAMITDGQIANADISATAAIDPSKVTGTAWTSTNDGAGSGLDADLLDGSHAGAFAIAGHDHVGQEWSGAMSWSNSTFKVTNSLNGPSIWGVNNGGGNGIRGSATGTGLGVYGESEGSAGVRGGSTSGSGVYGESSSGYGVYGYNSLSGNYGFLGSSSYGVYGYHSINSNYGLLGGSMFGVYGYSSSGTGVYGFRSGGGDYAGYFSGNVYINGNYTATGTKSFKIDHPLDPANKYLVHFCVESNELLNIYNGNITLDANGEAWIELPTYFETLNKDFRYQLTCIGGFAPVYIAQEISGNRFKIAGGNPGMKVSYQVTGIRHDAFAEAHRIQVEVEKTGAERGKYIHPKEHGVSETLGIDYVKHHEMEEQMKAEQEKKRAKLEAR